MNAFWKEKNLFREALAASVVLHLFMMHAGSASFQWSQKHVVEIDITNMGPRRAPGAAQKAVPAPKPAVKPQRIALARTSVDSSDRFLYHKTTNRAVYEAAKTACPGFDDVLLFNEQGEITESTIANVAVDIAGKLYTPPVSCGLLPGALRAHLLEQGELIERRVAVTELLQCSGAFLLNSVRGLYPVEVVQVEDPHR